MPGTTAVGGSPPAKSSYGAFSRSITCSNIRTCPGPRPKAEPVAAFEALGIKCRILPQRVYRAPSRAVASSRFGCLSRWTPSAPSSSTPSRATGPRRRSVPGRGAPGDLWKALWDRGHKIEIDVVAVVRTWQEDSRACRVLANWTRYPRPSEMDEEASRDIARIEQAILKGDVWVLDEYRGFQAAMRRSVVLEKRARRRAGRGLMARAVTWRTDRLAEARSSWEAKVLVPYWRCG